MALIILEHQIQYQKSDVIAQHNTPNSATSSSAPPSLSGTNPQNNADVAASVSQRHSELKYMVGRSIPQQPMFVAAVLSALRMQVCPILESVFA